MTGNIFKILQSETMEPIITYNFNALNSILRVRPFTFLCKLLNLNIVFICT
jgi:hypothetical protein